MTTPGDTPELAGPAPDAAALTRRFRVWLAWSVAIAAGMYVGYSAWIGLGEVSEALGRFSWGYLGAAVGLTIFVNYLLRWLKLHWLLTRIGVRLPWGESLTIFLAGFAMILSPFRAGEVLKPYLVRERSGVPMLTVMPALVAERLTDGLAVLVIAAVSVSKFAGDQAALVYGTIAVTFLGVFVLMNERLSLGFLALLARLPVVSRVAYRLEETYRAARLCLGPFPLLVTLVVSLVAWGAEAWGYQLIWAGFGRDVSLEAASFLYAFATAAGGASPGGLGVADGLLVTLPERLLGLPNAEVTATSMLIRGATLWLGVLFGAVALLFVEGLLARPKLTGQGGAPRPS